MLETIRKIINGEHPKLTPASENYDLHGGSNLSEVMERVDCLPYRNVLNVSTLKKAAAFMGAKVCFGVRAQICALY